MSNRFPTERARHALASGYRTVQVLTYGFVTALVVLAIAEPEHHLAKLFVRLSTGLINAILN